MVPERIFFINQLLGIFLQPHIYLGFRALKPPGWRQEWHCCVRVAKNDKLVGFIGAIPCSVRIYDQ